MGAAADDDVLAAEVSSGALSDPQPASPTAATAAAAQANVCSFTATSLGGGVGADDQPMPSIALVSVVPIRAMTSGRVAALYRYHTTAAIMVTRNR